MYTAETRDSVLIEAVSRGDEAALAAVIDRYTAYVWTIVWNITADQLDPAEARGIVSEVFFTLWRNAASSDLRSLRGYLSRIARSRAVDALRRRKRDLPLEEDALELPIEGPETEAVRRVEYTALRQAVEGLPEPDRTIFLRHYYYYQSTTRIAAELGINVNTVKSKLRRGRDILRRTLIEGGYFID